jgi:hypothetical protein
MSPGLEVPLVVVETASLHPSFVVGVYLAMRTERRVLVHLVPQILSVMVLRVAPPPLLPLLLVTEASWCNGLQFSVCEASQLAEFPRSHMGYVAVLSPWPILPVYVCHQVQRHAPSSPELLCRRDCLVLKVTRLMWGEVEEERDSFAPDWLLWVMRKTVFVLASSAGLKLFLVENSFSSVCAQARP